MEHKSVSRRTFLAKSIMASGGIILTSHLASCVRDFTGDGYPDEAVPRFLHGVASFDPTSEAVLIWTRFTPTIEEVGGYVPVRWQVALDAGFMNIVQEGVQYTSASKDFTIMEDVVGLEPNQKYFYRFLHDALKEESVIGETITLPSSGSAIDNVKFAVCSCSNFPAGLFNVYDAIAKSDADVVLHLGDYIYEYEEGGYGTNENTEPLKRVHDPKNEILTLEDYRLRYRQYRTDEGLQLAHQKKPFIIVWDDHEITNDAYKDGAENHDDSEGSYELRKRTAIKVHGEYLPVRTNQEGIIYRNFEFGNLVNLVMLDTRITGRDKQLAFSNFFKEDGSFDFSGFASELGNPNRELLGNEQLMWARNTIGGSNATWQVLGQQILMGKMWVPAELLIAIGTIASGNASEETLSQLAQTLTELSTLKARALQGDTTLTPQELGRINTVVPYNLDAWDGYAVEREKLFQILKGKKTVVLAGDTHNAWHSELLDANDDTIGVEFASPSVTSPGFDGLFGTDPTTITGIEQAFTLLIDGLKYFDASRRGYVLVEISASAASASYRYVNTIATKNYTTVEGNSESYMG